MGLSDKKRFNEKLLKWKENKDVLKNYEVEYLNKLGELYKEKFDDLIVGYKQHLGNNDLKIIERKNFIETSMESGLRIRIEFDEPLPKKEFNFNLAITEETRREYVITIKPDYNIFIPAVFKERPEPKSIDHVDLFIKNIENDYIHLQKEFSKLKKIRFYLTIHNSEYKPKDISDLKRYNSLSDIVETII